jgi:hypothetical protein
VKIRAIRGNKKNPLKEESPADLNKLKKILQIYL